MKNKLTLIEAIAVISIITISQIILDFPKYLIRVTGTGTIMNLVCLGIFVIVFCLLLTKILQPFTNQDILDISELIGGKRLKHLISCLFILLFFLGATSATSNFIYLLKNIYFKNASLLFVLSIFLISILVACHQGFPTIKKVSTFFFGILIISILSLPLGDNGNFNTNNLIPVFGYNYQTTFQTGIINLFIFNFVLIYFFLMPLLSQKKDFSKTFFLSFFINFSLIIVAVIAILQYYPTSITDGITNISASSIILAVTRRIQINSFLSQTDSIFILVWGYAILSYVSLLVNGIIYILDKNFHYQCKEELSFSLIPTLLGSILLINNKTKLYYLESVFLKNYSMILTFGICFFVSMIGYFKIKKGFHHAQK